MSITAGPGQAPPPSPVALPPAAPAESVFSGPIQDRFDLYLPDTTGETVQPFSSLPYDGACLAYSLDGSRLAFCANQDSKDELFISSGDGTNPQRLTY